MTITVFMAIWCRQVSSNERHPVIRVGAETLEFF